MRMCIAFSSVSIGMRRLWCDPGLLRRKLLAKTGGRLRFQPVFFTIAVVA
jgi:hypothetical protein